jgi:hypothetical protein
MLLPDKPPRKPPREIHLGGNPPSGGVLAAKMRRNNPHNEPTGPFTGRCGRCGSQDLVDDNMSYVCGDCGAVFASG